MYTSEPPASQVKKLKDSGKRIWLLGGAELITLLCNADLVDELIITIVPTILGEGIPLFKDIRLETKWKFVEQKSWPTFGVTQTSYKRANV